MTASMYILLALTLLFANLPFLTQRVLGFLPVARKHFGYHLIELAIGFALTAVFAYILESRSGSVHEQGWAFYVVAVCLYLVFAFPAFVWRYFSHSRHKESRRIEYTETKAACIRRSPITEETLVGISSRKHSNFGRIPAPLPAHGRHFRAGTAVAESAFSAADFH